MMRHCRTSPLCLWVLPPWGQAQGTFIAFIELSGDIGPQKANTFDNLGESFFFSQPLSFLPCDYHEDILPTKTRGEQELSIFSADVPSLVTIPDKAPARTPWPRPR